jgi:uncharacterized protein (DUF433 family)
MSSERTYQHLEYRPGATYRQLYVKGTRLRAETLYRPTVPSAEDGDARTPEEVAEDFGVPLEVVLEAIAYCASNPPEIAQDRAREERLAEATGLNHPDYKWNPAKYYRRLTPEERKRIRDDGPLPG